MPKINLIPKREPFPKLPLRKRIFNTNNRDVHKHLKLLNKIKFEHFKVEVKREYGIQKIDVRLSIEGREFIKSIKDKNKILIANKLVNSMRNDIKNEILKRSNIPLYKAFYESKVELAKLIYEGRE